MRLSWVVSIKEVPERLGASQFYTCKPARDDAMCIREFGSIASAYLEDPGVGKRH